MQYFSYDETAKKDLPNQKEIDEGGAFYYMTQLRTSEDVGDKDQLVYRVTHHILVIDLETFFADFSFPGERIQRREGGCD